MTSQRLGRLALSLLVCTTLAAACGEDTAPPAAVPGNALAEGAGPLLFVSSPDAKEALADALAYAPLAPVPLEAADPVAALGPARAEQIRVAVVKDERCAECFRLEGKDGVYTIRGGGPAGLSYGVTTLLEQLGYTFFHPQSSAAPKTLLRPSGGAAFDVDHSPVQTLRGVQLHTLHPIEAYYDFWERGPESLERAKRTIDWIVRNRGNFVQWVALGDVQADSTVEAAYRAHTKAITAYAHRRGVRIGVAVQLFKQGSLQNNYILSRGPDDIEGQIKTEIHRLVDDTGIDMVSLNFGEFTGKEPAEFISGANTAIAAVKEAAPGVEVSGSIHVGEHNRVEYEGESLIYYFLIDKCDPSLKRWVHSVMYYDLEGNAGGSYDHATYHEHRDLIKNKIAKGEQVAYFPESAYWIAFDNSVPTYLPIYVEQRRRDLAALPGLKEHVLFTSGWEWGYWQTDAATLRMGYALPATTRAVFGDLFAPLGATGEKVATLLTEVAEEQRTALVDQVLAAFVAGRDTYIDLGDRQGIHSQPDRLQPTEVVELATSDPAAFAAFQTNVVTPLEAHAVKLEGFAARATEFANDENKALREIADGLSVTALRTRYSVTIYKIAVALGQGEATEALFAEANAKLEAGKLVVAKRHADLWDPKSERLLTSARNATQYPFGYLKQAHTLCLWSRELVEVTNLRDGTKTSIPDCGR